MPGLDQLFESPAELEKALRWCLKAVPQYNGRRMIKRMTPAVVMVGDASETSVAGFTPTRELMAALAGGAPPAQLAAAEEAWQQGLLERICTVVHDYTTEELAQLRAGNFSSTLREVLVLRVLLEEALARRPDALCHQRLQYQSDSQSGAYAINGMKGCPSVFPEVCRIWELCLEHDIEMEVVWRPRSMPHQELADALSKVHDSSQWLLNHQVYRQVVVPAVAAHGRRIEVDLFADAESTKVPGSFYSRYYCPGSLGVNAFAQQWAWALGEGTKTRRTCFCNGPFDRMADIVAKIVDERVDVALVYPVWPKSWRFQLESLGAPLKQVLDLPHQADLFKAGPRVPNRAGKPKAPSYRVRLAVIIWDRDAWI